VLLVESGGLTGLPCFAILVFYYLLVNTESSMKASEMNKGQTIKLDDKIYVVVDYQHVKLGKGGGVYQTKIKGIEDGTTRTVRLRSDENVEQAYMDKKQMEYLYSSGDQHVLMDTETFEQTTLNDDMFGDGQKYLKPNERLQLNLHEGRPVTIELPRTVDLEVKDTPPEIKGATATNQYKPATMETGLVVQVPPFVENGEVVRVDTRTGEYVTRVKE
jgi:elongation factor P